MSQSRFPGEPTHHVKVRLRGEVGWKFLTPKGGTNRLRVHAAEMTKAGAEALVLENTAGNPEWEFKVTPINRGK